MEADDLSRDAVIEAGYGKEDAAEADDRLSHSQTGIVDDHVDLGQEPGSHSPQHTLKTHGHLHDGVGRALHLEPLEGKGPSNQREGDDEGDTRKDVTPVSHEHHEPGRHRRLEFIANAHPVRCKPTRKHYEYTPSASSSPGGQARSMCLRACVRVQWRGVLGLWEPCGSKSLGRSSTEENPAVFNPSKPQSVYLKGLLETLYPTPYAPSRVFCPCL